MVQHRKCAGGGAGGVGDSGSGGRRIVSAHAAELAQHGCWVRFTQYPGFRNRSYVNRLQRGESGRLLSRLASAAGCNAGSEVSELLDLAVVEQPAGDYRLSLAGNAVESDIHGGRACGRTEFLCDHAHSLSGWSRL